MTTVAIRWDDIWGQFKLMPHEMMREFANALDDGEDGGFERWLRSRSPKVQVEILQNAPVELQRHLYDEGILEVEAVFKLGIRSDTPVKDMRWPKPLVQR